jgi:GNAT superfamily N-acetyltransferase
MPSHVCWLGWFAIRPQFRRQGFGTAAIQYLRVPVLLATLEAAQQSYFRAKEAPSPGPTSATTATPGLKAFIRCNSGVC